MGRREKKKKREERREKKRESCEALTFGIRLCRHSATSSVTLARTERQTYSLSRARAVFLFVFCLFGTQDTVDSVRLSSSAFDEKKHHGRRGQEGRDKAC